MTSDDQHAAPFARHAISLEQLALSVVTVPHREHFRSAIGSRRVRRALLVRWTDADGRWGIGECACRPDPYFNGEFVEGAICVIRDHLFPQLPRRGQGDEVLAVLNRVRGWPFTVAAVLDAVVDLMRRTGHRDELDRALPVAQTRIPVGLSLPLFDTPEAAVTRVERAVAAGYRRVKMKVTPGMNLATLAAVREAFPSLHLGFDANGSCGEADLPFLEALASFQPDVLEQPFAPRRLDLCAALKERRPDQHLCLDESIGGLGDVITAHRLGAMDELNLKPGRVGGMLATVRILRYCAAHDVPVWVGGMFETGIGRTAGLRVAARLPEAQAHDLCPPGAYLVTDLIAPPLTMDDQGYVSFTNDGPVRLDEAVIEQHCTRQILLQKA